MSAFRSQTVTDNELFVLCGFQNGNALHQYLFRLMQEEAMMVATTLVPQPLGSHDLTNGHTPAPAQVSEQTILNSMQTVRDNARAATRAVYDRGAGDHGENWIIRILILNALARIAAART